jgi:hypothetical protein
MVAVKNQALPVLVESHYRLDALVAEHSFYLKRILAKWQALVA